MQREVQDGVAETMSQRPGGGGGGRGGEGRGGERLIREERRSRERGNTARPYNLQNAVGLEFK